MKNLLLITLLFGGLKGSAQSLCLEPMCTAIHAHQGDTVTIGAFFSAVNSVSTIAFTQIAGPSNAVISPVVNSWLSGIADTGRVAITGLVAGTYLFKVIGTDKAGGTVSGVDSVVVAPAVVVTARTIIGITISLFGVTVTIPAGQGTKVTFSDGTSQTW
jgi:hypothetical protein